MVQLVTSTKKRENKIFKMRKKENFKNFMLIKMQQKIY